MIFRILKSLFKTLILRGFLFVLIVSCDNQSAFLQVKEDIVEIADSSITNGSANQAILHYFDSLAAKGKFNGVALFSKIAEHTELREGFREKSKGDSLLLVDQFQLASLSKPITAFGLLYLVNEGKVELDNLVVSYLWDFPYPDITVRSLLNHTSGMGNYIYVTDSLWNNPDSFMSNRDMYNILRCEQVPTYYKPFKRFNYCNTNYALIPVLIEEVTGLTFPDFMRMNIFEPLGMLSTFYCDPAYVQQYDVLGHYPDGSTKKPFYLDAIIGDKSLYSSVYDLYKFYEEVKHPTLVSKRLLDQSMSIEVRSGSNGYYGLGWRIRPIDGNDTLIYHNGWWRGFRSYFWMSKRSDKVAIILTNSIRGGYLNQKEIWNLF